jgi:UDP-N-acetylmuramate dehydrogenase
MHLFDDLRGTVKLDEPLAPLVWFRLGGPAAYFASPRQLDELIALLQRCRQEGVPFKILGGGSNVLIRDEGIAALVIHLESPFFSDLTVRGNVVQAGHGRWRSAG